MGEARGIEFWREKRIIKEVKGGWEVKEVRGVKGVRDDTLWTLGTKSFVYNFFNFYNSFNFKNSFNFSNFFNF